MPYGANAYAEAPYAGEAETTVTVTVGTLHKTVHAVHAESQEQAGTLHKTVHVVAASVVTVNAGTLHKTVHPVTAILQEQAHTLHKTVHATHADTLPQAHTLHKTVHPAGATIVIPNIGLGVFVPTYRMSWGKPQPTSPHDRSPGVIPTRTLRFRKAWNPETALELIARIRELEAR